MNALLELNKMPSKPITSEVWEKINLIMDKFVNEYDYDEGTFSQTRILYKKYAQCVDK